MAFRGILGGRGEWDRLGRDESNQDCSVGGRGRHGGEVSRLRDGEKMG